MRHNAACLAGILALLLAPATFAQKGASETPRTGSTVVGDQDAAFGLVLQPWREEPVSDIDRPPRVRDLGVDAAALRDVRARSKQYEALRRFYHAQPKRR